MAIADQPRTAVLGTLLFPDFQPFAFQTQRLLCEAPWGGGDATEAGRATARMRAGDFDSWYEEWRRAAEYAREGGDRAKAAGHLVTARARYFAAANYYRSAEFFLPHDDPRALPMWREMAAGFHEAGDLWDPPFEWFGVEYEDGVELPGYIARPAGPATPRPTVVYLNGADGTKEESWFLGGRAFVERGVNFVTIDGPGQGEPLRLHGATTRPDYEAAISPVLDRVLKRDDVDADRVGLVGISVGGYYAARVAAHEKRFRAVAVHGACFKMKEEVWDHYPVLRRQLTWITGSPDEEAAERALAEYDLTSHAPLIDQPIYITHGADDALVDPSAPARLHEAVSSQDKTLRMWTADGLGGSTHCSVDNPVEVYPELCDWMVDHLR